MTRRIRNGSTPTMIGGTLLVRAIRTFRRNRRRAVIQAIVGTGLLAFGLRQRRTGSGGSAADETGGAETDDESILERARSVASRGNLVGQEDANPRGVTDEPDVETETDPHEGSVQFTEEHDEEPHATPHLDEGPHDSRTDDRDDEEVEIDLSEAALADEASEATGPEPEQAQPASTEGTEPEPTPEEDASHMRADEPHESDADSHDGIDDPSSQIGEENGEEMGEDDREEMGEENESGANGGVSDDDEGDEEDAG